MLAGAGDKNDSRGLLVNTKTHIADDVYPRFPSDAVRAPDAADSARARAIVHATPACLGITSPSVHHLQAALKDEAEMDFSEIPQSDYELPGEYSNPQDGPKGLLRRTGSFESRGRKRKNLVWASGEWLLAARSASGLSMQLSSMRRHAHSAPGG